MAKKSIYQTYDILTGLTAGQEDSTFKDFRLTRIKNFNFRKPNALESVEKFKSLGLPANKNDFNLDIINLIRYRNSILAFNYREIFKIVFNNDNSYNFFKIGDYLNAHVDSFNISQFDSPVFDPDVFVVGIYAYCCFRHKNEIYFYQYNLESSIIEYQSKISNPNNLEYLRIKVDLSENKSAYNLNNIFVLGADASNMVHQWSPIKSEWKALSVDNNWKVDSNNETLSFSKNNETRVLYHFQKWGDFVYDKETYSVIRSFNDAFFIVNSEGTPVCKIGHLTAPPNSNQYFLKKGNIRVVNDEIHIPVLLSNKETTKNNDEIDKSSLITFPVGLSFVRIKIDKLVPKIKALEYNSGLLISGPLLQNYDGEKVAEFNFNERLDNQFDSVEIQPQFKGNGIRFDGKLTFFEGSIVNRQFEGKGNFEEDRTSARLRLPDVGDEEFDVNNSGGLETVYNTRLFTDDMSNIRVSGRTGAVSDYNGKSLFKLRGGSFDKDDFELKAISLDSRTKSIDVLEFGNLVRPEEKEAINQLFANNDIYIVASSSKSDMAEGKFIAWKIDSVYVRFFTGNDLDLRANFTEPIIAIQNDDSPEVEDLTYFRTTKVDPNTRYDPSVLNGIVSNYFDFSHEGRNLKLKIEHDTVFKVFVYDKDTPNVAVNENIFDSLELTKGNDKITLRLIDGGNVLNKTGRKERSWTARSTSSQFEVGRWEVKADNEESQKSKWQTETAENITNKSIDDGTTIDKTKLNAVRKIEINEEANQVKILFQDNVKFFNDKNFILRLFIDDSIYRFLDYKTDDGNDRQLIFPKSLSFNTEIISSLIQGPRQLDKTVDVGFELIEVKNADIDLLKFEEFEYNYAGFFRFIDQSGKEHYSGLPSAERVKVSGLIGMQKEPEGFANPTKISIDMRFKNLNLTSKPLDKVDFVLVRARRTGKSPDAFFKIVKQIPINISDEWIEITDDVLDDGTLPRFNIEEALGVFQPPGCRYLSVGKRNRVFLAEIIGFPNVLLYSNFISNSAVEIFAFKQRLGGDNSNFSGQLVFDNKIIGLGNLDTNLAVFTERGIFYLPVQVEASLNPQFIQDSEKNFATQSEGIVEFKGGVMYVNNKGIYYLGRGFDIRWRSRDLVDFLELKQTTKDPIFRRIIDAYVSEIDNQVKFRVINSDKKDAGYLINEFEYGQLWSEENYIIGPEIEILKKKYKFSNKELYVSDNSINAPKRDFEIETGWLNLEGNNQGKILLRSIYLIGEFGNYDKISMQCFYNGVELANPEFFHEVREIKRKNIIQFSSRVQKISSLKLIFKLKTDICKITSVGFEIRTQTSAPKIGISS